MHYNRESSYAQTAVYIKTLMTVQDNVSVAFLVTLEYNHGYALNCKEIPRIYLQHSSTCFTMMSKAQKTITASPN